MGVAVSNMINISSPVLIGHEREYVLDCIDTAELSSIGKYVKKFEDLFADFADSPYAFSCSSGTAGLHLALLALDIGPEDKVLLPALTYVATANAVRYCGAEPVFCDVSPDTWCIDPENIRWKIKNLKYKNLVIMPVHLYGVMANMKEIQNIAEEYGAYVVEDAAQAHGGEINGQRAGSFGDIGVFSFYGSKIITCGEGGMVVTNNSTYADRIRLFRGQGQTPGKRYQHEVVGYNYRMTNLQAAVGFGQLEKFDTHKALRKKVMYWYKETHLNSIDRQKRPEGSADWIFSVLVPRGINRDTVIDEMLKQGVETRPVFPLLTDFPMYPGFAPINSRSISNRGLSLPTHAELTKSDIDYIAKIYFEVIDALRN